MEKSDNLNDNDRCKAVAEELARFKKLVEGHKKLLAEIGNL